MAAPVPEIIDYNVLLKVHSIFLLSGEVIKYPGDPLQDFSLSRFLDRFVFKNPKKNIKEEVVRNSKFSRKKAYIPSGIRSLRVDSASYLNEDESKIPVDELFLYRLVLSC
jgi:ribosome biogenesis protein MAK21